MKMLQDPKPPSGIARGSLTRSTCGLIIVAVILLVLACSVGPTREQPDTVATMAAAIAATQEAAASATPVPTLPPVPTQTPTPVPPTVPPTPLPSPSPTLALTAVQAKVEVTSIVLRAGPSTVHSKLASYSQGTSVTVLGKAMGDDWVLVETPDGKSGWMSIVFLSEFDVKDIPVSPPAESLVISGQVVDTSDAPIDRITVAVWQDTTSGQNRTDAHSGQDGTFYAYLPEGSQGDWNVGVVGIGCTSRIADADCKYTGSFIAPTVTIQVPQTQPVTFVYDPTRPRPTGE